MVKKGSNGCRIIDQMAELFEAAGIFTFGEPYLEIAITTVFIRKVLEGAMEMAVAVEFGIVSKTILNGASNDGRRIDKAIRFCHNHAIDVSGLSAF